jgi:hypothetical protein
MASLDFYDIQYERVGAQQVNVRKPRDEINAHIERNRIPHDRIDPLVASR